MPGEASPGIYYEKVYSKSIAPENVLFFCMSLLYGSEMKKPCWGSECFLKIKWIKYERKNEKNWKIILTNEK